MHRRPAPGEAREMGRQDDNWYPIELARQNALPAIHDHRPICPPSHRRRYPRPAHGARLCGGAAPRDRGFPGAQALAPVVPRGRGRRGQDGDREGPRDRPAPAAGAPAMLRGPRHRVRGLRMELSAPDDRDPAGGGLREGGAGGPVARYFYTALPPEASVAAGDRSQRWRGARPSDRRARPHGRAFRGLSARSVVRFPGVDSGTRFDRGKKRADRGHHIESHARDPRRDQAPLPLSLGRLSRRAARACDPSPQMSARAGDAGARDRRLYAAAALDGSLQGARHCRNAGLGRGAAGARSHCARPAHRGRHARCASQISGRRRGDHERGRRKAGRRSPCGRDCSLNPDAARVATLPRGFLADNVLHFVRVLRAAGLPLGPARVIDAIAAVEAVGIANKTDFREALAAVLVSRHEHLVLFEQAFDLFWRNPKLLERMIAALLPRVRGRMDDARDEPELPSRLAQAMLPPRLPETHLDDEDEVELDAAFTFSPREVLQTKDFATMTTDELAQVKSMLARLKLPLPERPVRRTRAAARGRRVDLRATMRGMTGAAGAVAPLAYRARVRRTPPLVVLCDISGSMDRYARMLLHFLHAITNDRHRVHTLVFGTRLTNITRHLKQRDVDVALARVTASVQDWAGGTRIGACLHD